MTHTIMFATVGLCLIMACALFSASALTREGKTQHFVYVYLKQWFLIALLVAIFAGWLWQLSGG
jgi:hypothetical protein